MTLVKWPDLKRWQPLEPLPTQPRVILFTPTVRVTHLGTHFGPHSSLHGHHTCLAQLWYAHFYKSRDPVKWARQPSVWLEVDDEDLIGLVNFRHVGRRTLTGEDRMQDPPLWLEVTS